MQNDQSRNQIKSHGKQGGGILNFWVSMHKSTMNEVMNIPTLYL